MGECNTMLLVPILCIGTEDSIALTQQFILTVLYMNKPNDLRRCDKLDTDKYQTIWESVTG